MSACSQCGTVVKPADKFCNVCGSPIVRANPPTPGASYPPPTAASPGAPPAPLGGSVGSAGSGSAGPALCQNGHEIQPGASYCALGHPMAAEPPQFASDPFPAGYGGAASPQGSGFGASRGPSGVVTPPPYASPPANPFPFPPANQGNYPQGGPASPYAPNSPAPYPAPANASPYGSPPNASPNAGAYGSPPNASPNAGAYGSTPNAAPFGQPPNPYGSAANQGGYAPPNQAAYAAAYGNPAGQPGGQPAFPAPPLAPQGVGFNAGAPYAQPAAPLPALGSPYGAEGALEASPPRVLRGFLVAYGTNPNGDFWPLTAGRHAVGRFGTGDGLDIPLQDPTISSRHAALLVDAANGSVTVEDTGSTNGTFVNDEPIGYGGRRDLRDGDRVRFGGFTTVVKVVGRV